MTGSWLYHFLGLSGSGPYYAFWSAAGSDISELAIPVALYGLLRKHNCHSKGCWRIGRHMVGGTPWCDRHHRAARSESEAE